MVGHILCLNVVSEQRWLVDNYIRETCAFHQLHIPTSGRNCDIKVPLQNLDVPMLPCNFLPIEPRLYIGNECNWQLDFAN